MMSSRISLTLKHFYKRSRWNCRLCSTVPQTTDEKDPAPIFFDQYVQSLLTTLTRMDYRTVFAARRDGTPLEEPKFKFMTDEQLLEARSRIGAKARGRIQMPPVVRKRSNEVHVISEDFGIEGFDKCNYVFTDISFGNSNRKRLIVVREPNGLLRYADSNERHRMNQIYFPINGREIHTPRMFRSPYLDNLLEKEEFEFILDRACLQFEPDDPEYHKISRLVYAQVNKLKKFDALRSSRHFGPFAFYLVWESDMSDLLLDTINSGHIDEAAALIRLYHKVHPDAKSGREPMQNDIDLIRLYSELDSPQRHKIAEALRKYEIMMEEREKMEKGIMKAHGASEESDGEAKT